LTRIFLANTWRAEIEFGFILVRLYFLPNETRFAKRAVGSRHARGKLAEEHQSCVDEVSFAVLRHQKAALERILARVAARKDGAVLLVRTIDAPFLIPAHKIVAGNPVRSIGHGVVRSQERYGRILVREAVIRDGQAVGREL
jgi:hypothetical protein